jgi:hypothetical protein
MILWSGTRRTASREERHDDVSMIIVVSMADDDDDDDDDDGDGAGADGDDADAVLTQADDVSMMMAVMI